MHTIGVGPCYGHHYYMYRIPCRLLTAAPHVMYTPRAMNSTPHVMYTPRYEQCTPQKRIPYYHSGPHLREVLGLDTGTPSLKRPVSRSLSEWAVFLLQPRCIGRDSSGFPCASYLWPRSHLAPASIGVPHKGCAQHTPPSSTLGAQDLRSL